MILYLMRHGDATATEGFEQSLTEKGRLTTEKIARLLAASHFDRPEAIHASPLLRAQQTAAIVQSIFALDTPVSTTNAVASDAMLEQPMSLIASLAKQHRSLMLIGHDPLMSRLASAILTGNEQIAIEMTKSAVAIFEITRFQVPRMRGVLRAFLPPTLLA